MSELTLGEYRDIENAGEFDVQNVGTFQVTGGKVMCTDPCYERGTWCQKELPALDGTWTVLAYLRECEGWGNRVWELRAYHESYDGPSPETCLDDADIGVDSGQFGFFDGVRYPQDTGDWDEGGSNLYSRICDAAFPRPDDRGGRSHYSVDEGCVSRSGIGDGGYPLYAEFDGEGRAVALRCTFLTEDYGEDDDSDDDGDDDLEEEEELEEPTEEPGQLHTFGMNPTDEEKSDVEERLNEEHGGES